MKDLLEYFLEHIVDHPEKTQVSQISGAPGQETFRLSVDNSDMGKVIGKGGRIIKAIRDLCKILAVKSNTKVNVVLAQD